MTVRNDCFNYFKEQQTVSTREIHDWYSVNKSDPSKAPYRCQVHQLIIDPLIKEGRLVRVSKGFYKVCAQAEQAEEDREWNEYIQRKIKEADEKMKGGDQ